MTVQLMAPGDRDLLPRSAANFDPDVFENPEQIRLI